MARKRYEAVSLTTAGNGLFVKWTSAQTLDWIVRRVREQVPECRLEEWGEGRHRLFERGPRDKTAWDIFVTLCHAGWIPLEWDGRYRLRWEGQMEEE